VHAGGAGTGGVGLPYDLVGGGEAEVVVRMPLGERAADVRPRDARPRTEIHGTQQHRTLHRVGVDQRGGVVGVEDVTGPDDLPVGVVDLVSAGLVAGT
jgi:hypothetical protein